MRLKLTLNCRPNSTLSLNYHYALQAVIYKVLERADPQFSHWLHEKGYEASGKNFKLFTFSELRGAPFFIDPKAQTICFRGNTVTWQVSFCVDAAVEKFITGLFQNQVLEVVTPEGRVHFTVQGVEMLPAPAFQDTMRFIATSPICLSEQTETDKQPQYRSPLHENFERLFFNNLKNKYEATHAPLPITNHPLPIINAPLPITNYPLPIVEPHNQLLILNEPRMKGLSVYKKNLARPIKTIGYTFEFEVTASSAWLRLGFEAGFGIQNSGGFGFCEVLN